ncbi:MAG: hypothetical protein EZS28_039753, partial [Streblomastix strix]
MFPSNNGSDNSNDVRKDFRRNVGAGIIPLGILTKSVNKRDTSSIEQNKRHESREKDRDSLSSKDLNQNQQDKSKSIWNELWEKSQQQEKDKGSNKEGKDQQKGGKIYLLNQKLYTVDKEDEFSQMQQKLAINLTTTAAQQFYFDQIKSTPITTSPIISIQMHKSGSIESSSGSSLRTKTLLSPSSLSISQPQAPPPIIHELKEMKNCKGINISLWMITKQDNKQSKSDDIDGNEIDEDEQDDEQSKSQSNIQGLNSPPKKAPVAPPSISVQEFSGKIKDQQQEQEDEEDAWDEEQDRKTKKFLTPENLISLYGSSKVTFLEKTSLSELITSGTTRNDIYLTITEGHFEKGKKKAEPNVELVMEVIDSTTNKTIENCIFIGKNSLSPFNAVATKDTSNKVSQYAGQGLSVYRSPILYHNKAPQWSEQIRIQLRTDQMKNAVLIFKMWHCSTNKKTLEPFAFAFKYLYTRIEDEVIQATTSTTAQQQIQQVHPTTPGQKQLTSSTIQQSQVLNQSQQNQQEQNTLEGFGDFQLLLDQEHSVNVLKWDQKKVNEAIAIRDVSKEDQQSTDMKRQLSLNSLFPSISGGKGNENQGSLRIQFQLASTKVTNNTDLVK